MITVQILNKSYPDREDLISVHFTSETLYLHPNASDDNTNRYAQRFLKSSHYNIAEHNVKIWVIFGKQMK